MVRRDALWKGILEDLVEEMLLFFFAKYADQIDFLRGFEFLDKELEQLYTASDAPLRHADKLIKAWLKNGAAHWFLLQIEVQGYPDKDFARRMFQSAYRIEDKFQCPVTALVIYTDGIKKHHPREYRHTFMGSGIVYRFNMFDLADAKVEELTSSDNIFAVVLQAAKAGVKRKPSDKQLSVLKTGLVRSLLQRGYAMQKVRKVINFIRYYVRFENEEETLNFEKTLDELFQNRKNMGIEEAILEDVKQQGLEQVIANGLQQGVSLELLASLTELPLSKVKEIAHAILNQESPEEGDA